jgi:hypothetical protein
MQTQITFQILRSLDRAGSSAGVVLELWLRFVLGWGQKFQYVEVRAGEAAPLVWVALDAAVLPERKLGCVGTPVRWKFVNRDSCFFELLILVARGLSIREMAFRTPLLGRSSVDQGSDLFIFEI